MTNAQFWLESGSVYGTKTVNGDLLRLEEVDDRSFAQHHSYAWFTKRGDLVAHLTAEDLAILPECGHPEHR